MRGADALVRALERAGVDTVFGIPGGACLPIYDALYDSPIRHVLMRHEAAAGHAAEGYARASGKVGVAIGTSGPGATNLVTAIADAQMDCTPTLFITGQVKTTLRGTNAFQEADVIGITQPIVKHSIAIERADDSPRRSSTRCTSPRSGRPGPVLIDLPIGHRQRPRARRDARPVPARLPPARAARTAARCGWAAEALAAARRPVLYAGGGVIQADAARGAARVRGGHRRARDDDADGARRVPRVRPELARDARHARPPRGELGDGRGRPDRRHRRPLRRPRDRRDRRVRPAARRSSTSTSTRREIGKIVAVDIPIVGDAKLALEALTRAYEKLDADPGRLDGWWTPHPRLAGRPSARAPEPEDGCADPEATLDALAGRARRRDRDHRRRPAPDVGGQPPAVRRAAPVDHQRRARHDGLRPARPRSAPQAAAPGTPVVCVSGEGSFLMNVQELATAVEEELPVKILLLDNACLGMVRQQQDMFWNGRRSAVDLGASPDWELLARAFGVAVRSIGDTDDVADALAETLAEDGPALLHVRIAPGGQLPADVPPGRSRPGDDRLSRSAAATSLGLVAAERAGSSRKRPSSIRPTKGGSRARNAAASASGGSGSATTGPGSSTSGSAPPPTRAADSIDLGARDQRRQRGRVGRGACSIASTGISSGASRCRRSVASSAASESLSIRSARARGWRRAASTAAARPTSSPACGPPSSLSPREARPAPRPPRPSAARPARRRARRARPSRRRRSRARRARTAPRSDVLDEAELAKFERCTRRIAPTSAASARS